MPPEQGIQWNKVTWYSKTLAVLLFVVLVCGAFFFGMWYQKQLSPAVQTLLNTNQVPQSTSTSEKTSWVSFSTFQVPPTQHYEVYYVQKGGDMYSQALDTDQ